MPCASCEAGKAWSGTKCQECGANVVLWAVGMPVASLTFGRTSHVQWCNTDLVLLVNFLAALLLCMLRFFNGG